MQPPLSALDIAAPSLPTSIDARRWGRALAAVAALGLAGCSTPLANRTARVLPVGEVELAGSVGGYGSVIGGGPSTPGAPHVEGSARFGIAENLDLQLRVDEQLFPELVLGSQLIGDQHQEQDVAVAIAAGARTAVFPDTKFANLSVPLMVLVDIPFEAVRFTITSRNIVGILFGRGGGMSFTPGLSLGATMPLGPQFFLRGELAGNTTILQAGGALDDALPSYGGTYAFALGLGYRFGDGPSTSSAAPAATSEATP